MTGVARLIQGHPSPPPRPPDHYLPCARSPVGGAAHGSQVRGPGDLDPRETSSRWRWVAARRTDGSVQANRRRITARLSRATVTRSATTMRKIAAPPEALITLWMPWGAAAPVDPAFVDQPVQVRCVIPGCEAASGVPNHRGGHGHYRTDHFAGFVHFPMRVGIPQATSRRFAPNSPRALQTPSGRQTRHSPGKHQFCGGRGV